MKAIKYNQERLEEILQIYLGAKPTFLSFIRPKEAALFNALLPYKKPILDFGCGDGFFRAMCVLGFNQKVDVGLEINEKRAQQAKKTGIYQKVVMYDGRVIPFRDETFQTILSNSVLEHVWDLDISIKEIFRIIVPGGIFYVSVMTKNFEENLFGTRLLGSLYQKWMKRKAYHVNLLRSAQWEAKFKSAGFKIEEKKGYLNKKNTRLLDIMHYVAGPGIIAQNYLPFLSRTYWYLIRQVLAGWIKHKILIDDRENTFSAYFYILRK